MVGVVPPTRVLLTKYGVVVGDFASRYEVAIHLGVTMNDDGVIHFRGKEQPMTYLLKDEGPIANNHFKSKEAALRDWAYAHMKLPSEYKMYRYIT